MGDALANYHKASAPLPTGVPEFTVVEDRGYRETTMDRAHCSNPSAHE